MCGIAGIFAADGRPIDTQELRRMTDVLRHRGPDDSGTWTAPGIGLGHRRLAIRDLSASGHQPMSDCRGQVVVTYNGEIYNDAGLRRELENKHGIRFRSQCDTEILPYGYLTWGSDFFNRLEGMFAFALWDAREQTLVLVRDGIGIKPLYYSVEQGVVRFGSEIKSLLAAENQPRTLDPAAIHRFVNMGYAGPESTLFAGIRQVPPGTALKFAAGGVQTSRFWRPRRDSQLRSIERAVEEFIPLWDEVVRDTLVSDVGVGVLQSGGIDSSLVAAAAQRADRSLPLFTVAFDEASHDESHVATIVANATRLPHTIVRFAEDLTPAETLKQVIRHTDGQLADESLMPLYLLSKHVREHVKVVMTGDGGDELFGGYTTYRATAIANAIRGVLPARLAYAAGRYAYRLSPSASEQLSKSALLSRFLLGLAMGRRAAHAHWRRYLPPFMLPAVYGPELRAQLDYSPFAEYEALVMAPAATPIDAALLADQQFHLPAGLLIKSDAMTMAHGLEARVPLLDRRIIDFAGRCHVSLLTGVGGESKRILRAALSRYGVPEAVVRAPKKGFNSPLAKLLRSSLREHGDGVFVRDVEVFSPFFSPAAIRHLWREHRDYVADHAYALWPLLVFGTWRPTIP